MPDSEPRCYLGLHGWNGGSHTFDPVRGAVPPGIRFFTPQLMPRETLHAMIGEIEEMTKQMGVRVTLIGMCSGAVLALHVAERCRRQVDRIVLIDAFAFWPWYFKVFIVPCIGRWAYYSTFANPVGRWLANAQLAAKRARQTDLTEGFARVDHELAHRFLCQLAEAGSLENIGNIEAQIDITYGERTFAAVKQSAEMFKARWPWARISPLAGAGHLPLQEAPEQLAQILFGKEALCTVNQP